MRRITAMAVAVVALALLAGPASAQAQAPESEPDSPNYRIDRFTAELIGDLLDTLGLRYSIGEGRFGQPAITVDGSHDVDAAVPDIDRFEVQFFGCDGDGRCDEMSLVSRYQPEQPTSLTTVNRFNQGTRFTTAYTGNEGDLILSMDLSAVGGIGRQATLVMIAIYVYNMESFAQAIGYS